MESNQGDLKAKTTPQMQEKRMQVKPNKALFNWKAAKRSFLSYLGEYRPIKEVKDFKQFAPLHFRFRHAAGILIAIVAIKCYKYAWLSKYSVPFSMREEGPPTPRGAGDQPEYLRNYRYDMEKKEGQDLYPVQQLYYKVKWNSRRLLSQDC